MGTSPDAPHGPPHPPSDGDWWPKKPKRNPPTAGGSTGPKVRPSKRDRADRAERIKRQVDAMAGKTLVE